MEEEKNNTYSFDITIEGINSILSKYPKENKISYERLLPVIEEKKYQFISRMISRIVAKRIDKIVKSEVKKDLKENTSKNITINGMVDSNDGYGKDTINKERVADFPATRSLFYDIIV
ncbi:hypothetical protein ICE98_02519 [Lactococcus lactis]|uniref:hypothetical protein n=1 Tax=Lactococcus lactis subsp. cremoris TaxID=1359 RepID=UPI0007AE63E3|nr:hypothetical protein [Lactococcus cremoris]KZK46759.1 hypothetical protein B40_0486 [Lactococcus cremoris]MDM5145385.1 hypothetical protein [Lactococcus lactis]